MWYNRSYETPLFIRPLTTTNSGRSKRACTPPMPLCCVAARSSGQRPRRTCPGHCPPAGLQRPDGAQRDPWLQCPGTGGAAWAPRVPIGCAPPSRTRARTPGRAAASQPARLWPRAEPLDLGLGCPGQLRAGLDRDPDVDESVRRALQRLSNQLEAGQALDHQPRSAYR